jgi:hypothetical protein
LVIDTRLERAQLRPPYGRRGNDVGRGWHYRLSREAGAASEWSSANSP